MPRPDYTLPLDQLPDPLPIEPLTRPFDVTITPPGSKSITCRAYVLAALAKGESKIIRPLRADDTDLLLKALCTLGAEARWDGEDVFIKGVGGRFPRGGSVNLGDGGTPTRFMIACACLAAEPVVVDGSKRMRERPIAEGVDMLRQLGAKIEYVEEEGRLPVRVVPSDIRNIEMSVPKLASSQFVSAMMLIAPHLSETLELKFSEEATSASYIHLTFAMLSNWEATTDEDLNAWEHDDQPSRVRMTPCGVGAKTYQIEPDASSALYWCAAAAIAPKASRIVVPNMASIQPDACLLYLLDDAGVEVRFSEATDLSPRISVVGRGTLTVPGFSASESPDGAVAIAAITPMARIAVPIRDLRTLRVKETDRIAALANELRKVGCAVETGEDWIEITPPAARGSSSSSSPTHAVSDDQREEDTDRTTSDARSGSSSLRSSDPACIEIETYNDHRMAMAFAVLGLAAPRITGGRLLAVRNPACVAKSYPTFWKDFAKLYQ